MNKSYNQEILKIAIPASLGFFFHTMFNVVDTYYAGLISTQALAGLSVSFPIFFLIIAVSNGLSTGTTSLIANYLGSKERFLAQKIFWQAISIGLVASFLISILGLFLTPLLLDLQGLSAAAYPYAISYLKVIFIGSFSFIFFSIFNAALIALGDSKKFRNAIFAGLILNLILNPFFMFTCKMGVAGIAFATILIESLQAIYLLYFLNRTGFIDLFDLRLMKPNRKLIIELIKHSGLAAMNMLAIGIGIFVILYFVSLAGDDAVAAYGIGIRIEQIFLLPAIGLSIATQSLAGRYNGAKDYLAVKRIYFQSLKFAFLLSIFSCGLIFIFKEFLIQLFTEAKDVAEVASDYLSYASFLLFIYSIIMISNSLFFAMKYPAWPMILGIIRLVVTPLIVLNIFYSLYLLPGVWLGVTLNNTLMAIVIYIVVLRKCFRVS